MRRQEYAEGYIRENLYSIVTSQRTKVQVLRIL